MSLFGLLTATAIAATVALPALAGDYADRNVLGFSPDGSTFAFEEYGIQDGSGFPFSNIYVIDTASDQWVSGSPVRVRIDNETVPLAQVRAQAASQASALLQSRGVGSDGRTLVHNPVNELSANPHLVAFRLHRFASEAYQIGLTEVDLPAADCPDFGQSYKGMQLVLAGPDGNRFLVNDARIPGSRNCPLNYGISEVIHYPPESGAGGVLIVLVNVFSVGFEGPDRRFIAVATTL